MSDGDVMRPYIDPTTGEWVGEHETRVDDEITRQTEWFDTESEARRFARTGRRDERATCTHCGRLIVQEQGRWVDPQATGDDSMWRETCDAHDTTTAEHEPELASDDRKPVGGSSK